MSLLVHLVVCFFIDKYNCLYIYLSCNADMYFIEFVYVYACIKPEPSLELHAVMDNPFHKLQLTPLSHDFSLSSCVD